MLLERTYSICEKTIIIYKKGNMYYQNWILIPSMRCIDFHRETKSNRIDFNSSFPKDNRGVSREYGRFVENLNDNKEFKLYCASIMKIEHILLLLFVIVTSKKLECNEDGYTEYLSLYPFKEAYSSGNYRE